MGEVKIISIGNTKGGVGKTTTARELSFQLAKDSRVIMIDFDPQASLTDSVSLPTPPPLTVADMFSQGKRLSEVAAPVTDNLWIAIGSSDLEGIEVSLVREHEHDNTGRYILQEAIKEDAKAFDYAVIDTVGTTAELVANALIAADLLIIPVRPQGTDLNALPKFLKLVERISQLPKVKLDKIGILPNEYAPHSAHHHEAVEGLKQLGYRMFPAIGRSTKVAEATYQQQTIEEWERRNPRSNEYAALAQEVKSWLERR